MGGAVSNCKDNEDLIDNLKAASYINTPLLERVFRAVDRGDYFTPENREQAYRDNAWKKGNLHLSAPCIYAKVMEGLQLESGHSFLNLGSGTGYLSTLAGLILGPHGINHGVELHADVVRYGCDKLEEFKRTSPAIDAFTFCDPQFVQGNCLCLPPDIQLYDRVYCGASCPETHENYMKALVKPGGVLVMPINDQLVKLTHRGPNNWETDSLLPVSFSSLIMPDPNHPPPTITLPDVELPDLQEVCRQELRLLLRSNIEHEHPDLPTAANKAVKIRKQPNLPYRRIIVPYAPNPFYESDDDAQMSDDETEAPDEEAAAAFGQRHTVSRISAFIEFARNLAGHRRLSTDEDEDDDEEPPRRSPPEERTVEMDGVEEDKENDIPPHKATTSNNSDGNHSVHDLLTTKSPDQVVSGMEGEQKSTDNMVTESPAGIEDSIPSASTVPHSDPIPVASTVVPAKCTKKREFDSGVGDEIENGKGPSSESDQGDDHDNDMEYSDSDYSDHSDSRPNTGNILDTDYPFGPDSIDGIFKAKRSDEAPDDDKDEDDEGNSAKTVSAAEMYSTYMKEKINLLPLPQALKVYLNYNREL